MPTWVITGANRGLGLEFARQLTTSSVSGEPNTVLALVRSATKTDLTALNKLKNNASNHTISIHECDTSSASSIESFATSLKSSSSPPRITHLLNNAGINSVPQQSALTTQAADLHAHIDTNVLGPALLVQQLFPLLDTGALVFNMTSGLGSFGREIFADAKTVYSVSKAALNMWSAHLATEKEVIEKKIRVLVMDPGWVKTDMGGPRAQLQQDFSISSMLKVVEEVKQDEGVVGTAVYRQYDGKVVPW